MKLDDEFCRVVNTTVMVDAHHPLPQRSSCCDLHRHSLNLGGFLELQLLRFGESQSHGHTFMVSK